MGVTKLLDQLVIDLHTSSGYHQAALAFHELIAGYRLYPEARSVGEHVNLAGRQPQAVTQHLGQHQPSGSVDGSAHTTRLRPFGSGSTRPVSTRARQ